MEAVPRFYDVPPFLVFRQECLAGFLQQGSGTLDISIVLDRYFTADGVQFLKKRTTLALS